MVADTWAIVLKEEMGKTGRRNKRDKPAWIDTKPAPDGFWQERALNFTKHGKTNANAEFPRTTITEMKKIRFYCQNHLTTPYQTGILHTFGNQTS